MLKATHAINLVLATQSILVCADTLSSEHLIQAAQDVNIPVQDTP